MYSGTHFGSNWGSTGTFNVLQYKYVQAGGNYPGASKEWNSPDRHGSGEPKVRRRWRLVNTEVSLRGLSKQLAHVLSRMDKNGETYTGSKSESHRCFTYVRCGATKAVSPRKNNIECK
jgi:hypothetical protein